MLVDKSYTANGKLLLTAEYFILDGAKGLALPTKYNQKLVIQAIQSEILEWKSYDENGAIWFYCNFDKHLNLIDYSDLEVAEMLLKILNAALQLNSSAKIFRFQASTYLNFNRHWGLGTSSTLISLIAQWFDINPYQLLEQTFGGSGYDIACATTQKPIIFYKNELQEPVSEIIKFNPLFKNQLYFVYLNQKQNSRTAIQYYKQTKIEDRQAIIQQLNELTKIISRTTDKFEFDKCLIKHENIISSFLSLEKVQDKFFSDFNGVVKSLGAWGGDFVLVSCNLEMGYVKKYFHSKGYNNIISFNDMIQD
ncbi:MAG: hypothetical protein K1X26_07995 [Chitinophagales bacterium]|nr:hypothetical protein [Chitinophagales bacterium]